MAVDGTLHIYVDAVAESGRDPESVPLSVKNKRADARRDDRICLARPNSQAQTRIGKKTVSLFS